MSILGISSYVSAPAVRVASTLSQPSAVTASQVAATAPATVSVAIPGSPFAQQVTTTPDSLVVKPQMPPLLFDSTAETLLSSAIGSLVDETA
jgi:hypothetical protein